MYLLSLPSPKKKQNLSTAEFIGSILIFFIFVLHSIHLSSPNAIADKTSIVPNQHDDGLADIVDPFKSTCYDWKGNIIPCDFKRQYAELLFDKPIPDPRFIDNQNGTLTGLMDWERANLAAKSLKNGDCGADPALILSDGSSAGDWRLPTMSELCTLIDFGRRDPALPGGHMFSAVPSGYHWSATTLDYHSGMAWIVYFESGTTCYEDVTNQAGHFLPVRKSLE